MSKTIDFKFNKFFLKDRLSFIITGFLLVVIFFLLFFSVKRYLSIQEQIEGLKQETNQLSRQSEAIRSSQALVQDQIDDFNKVLAILIPSDENYFSIISALEKISLSSGFVVVSYNINLSAGNKNRIAITIEGKGDANSFIKFLEDYRYSGGRLITIEKLDFSSDQAVNSKIILNFYNKKLADVNQNYYQITSKDVAILNKIKEKIKIDIEPQEQPVEVNQIYPTKSNPF